MVIEFAENRSASFDFIALQGDGPPRDGADGRQVRAMAETRRKFDRDFKWKDGDRSARRDRLKAEIVRLFAARKGKDGCCGSRPESSASFLSANGTSESR